MSPLVAYHATRRSCRNSIRKNGLLPGQPTHARPFGVYVYHDDFEHPTRIRGCRCVRWGAWYGVDVWKVAYIGPLTADAYVSNGLILLDSVPLVTLVTGNK